MKKNWSTIILFIVFFLGLSLFLYPIISDYWNRMHQSRAVASYLESVSQIDRSAQDEILQNAREYNRWLSAVGTQWNLTEEENQRYLKELDPSGSGIMGYIEIKKINCFLPIYHTIGEDVLTIGVGHIPGSSLPVGGKGSHCVLSGHRGLPSARLFTDLDELDRGDEFTIDVMGEVLTYKIDQILIVLPNDMDALRIDPEQDYCTLVTCTPYGINTHRILMRGVRVPNATTVRVVADAFQIQPIIIAPFVAAPIILLLLVWLMVSTSKNKRGKKG